MKLSPHHPHWFSAKRLGMMAASLSIVLLSGATRIKSAQPAPAYAILYSFTGASDGANPRGRLIQDTQGNLIGTTFLGGSSGFGTVFKLDPSGNETVLHSFDGLDGEEPWAGVIHDSLGNLYGTTRFGGANNSGEVFKLDPSGNLTLLHSFSPTNDGYGPFGGLILDVAGNLFGTTYLSSGFGNTTGTVFEISASGQETIIHPFPGGKDGASPTDSLTQDAAGNLYGTTTSGGSLSCKHAGCGTVFKVDPSGNETVLYSFGPGIFGVGPWGGVTLDAAGNLYGATTVGGGHASGAVFKLDPSGNETVLHDFTDKNDGGFPFSGPIRDAAGNLYGTVTKGGDPSCDCGLVYKITPSGAESSLHTFQGPDGMEPFSGLIRDAAGNFYGTTAVGGDNNAGVVFKISPQ
jgi:uncharacterized repeat protein (TIGR03803 family)